AGDQQDRPRAAGGCIAGDDGPRHQKDAWRQAVCVQQPENRSRPGGHHRLHRTPGPADSRLILSPNSLRTIIDERQKNPEHPRAVAGPGIGLCAPGPRRKRSCGGHQPPLGRCRSPAGNDCGRPVGGPTERRRSLGAAVHLRRHHADRWFAGLRRSGAACAGKRYRGLGVCTGPGRGTGRASTAVHGRDRNGPVRAVPR
nr:hypothetical protein [Tanacetum cinerariifolium]